ncbi:carbohydrate ABC transporter permease [Enterococcus sp. LJL120]
MKKTKRRTLKGLLYSQKVAPYVFILPFVLTFLLFWLTPIIRSGIMSFQNILMTDKWVGWANYSKLLNDKTFLLAIENSLIYTVLTIVVLIPIPLFLATLINSKLLGSRFKNIFKSSLFVPALTSVVVAGTIFRLIFGERDSSLMNELISLLGLAPIKWLKNRATAMFALVLLASWKWIGVNTMYFLSGLQSISEDYYEAASIDGATKWQGFSKITLPMLKPTMVYVLTISIYGGLSMFNESYVLWAGKASPNNIGLTIVRYLYQQGIEKNQMGYASAVGIVLLILVLGINLIQLTATGMFKKEER